MISLQTFVDRNRDELVQLIWNAYKFNVRDDDEELKLWVLNDESLYVWAQNEGVDV